MRWQPLKRYCDGPPQYGLNVGASEYAATGLRFIRTTDIAGDGTLKGNDSGVFLSGSDVGPEHQLCEGDLLFSRSGTLGRCLRYQARFGPASFAGYLVRFRPGSNSDPRFLAYYAEGRFFQGAIAADAVTSTISNFNADKYASILVPRWGLSEQRAISDYLDTETARIDALIAKKRQLQVLLDQREASLFEAAVRRSGFEFPTTINADSRTLDLPASWEVLHLSVLLEQLTNGFVGPTRDILVDEGVRYVQSLHIKRGRIDFHRRPFHVTPEWHRARPRIHLREGDVLIVQTGDIGQVAVVPRGFGEASCHALQIARVRPHLISGEFLGQYLRSHFGYQSLLSRATGALHPHLEGGIRDVPVLVPPLSEQSEILMEIADRRAGIEAARAPLTRQIDLLIEHRQALITAAVLGELEIPGVAA